MPTKETIGHAVWYIGAFKEIVYREDGQTPYIVRWHLLHTKWFRVMIHHILCTDETLCPHDHPWNFISIILKGAYTEHRFEQDFPRYSFDSALERKGGRYHTRTYYPAGSILYRPAATAHRLEVAEGKTTWTMVITSSKKRRWGFWSLGRFIPHKEFGSKTPCE